MRFKAMIEQPASIIRMLTSLSHMAKDCLIVLCRTTWKVMINEKFVPMGHPQCYASTPIAYVFSHYMIESQANNEILLQINIRNLLAAFRSVKEFNGGMTILKLTKKNGIAMLSFAMWQDDGNELRVNVIQDVTVKPIQHSKLYLYEEPALGQYDASSKLPELKSLKSVIEKMRSVNTNLSNEHGILYINNYDGKLLLEIETNHCKLKTIYSDLAVNNQQLHIDQNSNQRKKNIKAKIDLKYLSKVIQALQPLQVKQTVVAITKKTCVTIHARLNEYHNENNNNDNDDENIVSARITFYLCVYIDDEDDDDDDDEQSDDDDDDDQTSVTDPSGPIMTSNDDQEMRNID